MYKIFLAISIISSLTGCNQVKDFLSSPEGQKIEQEIESVVEEIVEDVIEAEVKH